MKKRSKKRIILLLLAIILVIVLGFFLWFRTEPSAAPLAAVIFSPKPTPYPKVEKFDIPILMYHYIRVAPANDQLGANLSVSPENFDAQMKYLYDNNYQTIKLADLADPSRQAISRIYFEKKKPIVITFDDGYADAYTTALPTLQKYHFIGTFFIIRNFVGKTNYLSQSQISKMQKAGMEIGSHTLDHVGLASLPFSTQKKQIFQSKQKASVFCYPFGKYDNTSISLVKEAGYLAAVTTHMGTVNEKSNLFELPRVRIGNSSVEGFKNQITLAEKNSWKMQ